MNIPTHLKHKPIIAVENYDRIDGPYADDTDAMGLSVGIAHLKSKQNINIKKMSNGLRKRKEQNQ